MKRILKIIVFILLITSMSCEDKEFMNELEFIHSILDNPDQMQEIIESSEFYDGTEFNTCGNKYKDLMNYLKLLDKNNIEVTIGRYIIHDKSGKAINCKTVNIYEKYDHHLLSFDFMEKDSATILLNICFVQR